MMRRLPVLGLAALALSACGGGLDAAPRNGDALPGALVASPAVARGDLATTRAKLEAQLGANPDRLGILVDLAATWELAGRPSAAEALLDEVISRGAPRDQQAALVDLGAIYAQDGYQSAAAAYLETARDMDPARPEPHYALALFATGRDDAKAQSHLREALRLDPTGSARAGLVFSHPEGAHELEALVAEARGDPEQAAAHWREVARGSFPALAQIAERRLER